MTHENIPLSLYADPGCKVKIGDVDRPIVVNPGFLVLNREKRIRVYLKNETAAKYLKLWSNMESDPIFWDELVYNQLILAPGESKPVTVVYFPGKDQQDVTKWPTAAPFRINIYDEHPDEYLRKQRENAGPYPPVTSAELEAARS